MGGWIGGRDEAIGADSSLSADLDAGLLLLSPDPMNRPSRRVWRVVDASFETSAPNHQACPPGDLPEIAFAGRSNVGKSSLLNAFTGRRSLARVSRTPGRTRLLNVFKVSIQRAPEERRVLRCVDLPGYGYAALDRATREAFAPMIGGYFQSRQALRCLVLLVDLRRGWTDLDRQMLGFAAERELATMLVGTKADKLSASERGLARRRLAADVGVRPGDVVVSSSTRGLGITGPGALADALGDLLGVGATEEPP